MLFANLKHLRTLLYYDGPFLEIVEHGDKKYFLSWANVIGEGTDAVNYYVAAEVTEQQITDYLSKKVSVYTIQKTTAQLWYGIYKGLPEDFLYQIEYGLIPDDETAPHTSYYDDTLDPNSKET